MRNFIVTILVLSAPLFAAEKADYILLSNPAAVIVLNKYEQKTDVSFLPGTPFRLEEQNHLLSDGITKVYKCSFDKKDWFLLPLSGRLALIKKCTVLNDHIRLTRPGIKIHTTGGQTESPAKGSILSRIFSKGSKTYVLSAQFGWAHLPKSGYAIIKKESPHTEIFPARLSARIISQIESVNDAYRTFFSFFNEKYQKNLKIPQWRFEQKEETLRLYLDNEKNAGPLSESFKAIENDLHRIVLGSGYRVIRKQYRFIISTRGAL